MFQLSGSYCKLRVWQGFRFQGRGARGRPGSAGLPIWEFPEIRGTLFWGPYNKDPTI